MSKVDREFRRKPIKKLVCGPAAGNPQCEGRSLAGFALRFDLAAVGPGDLAGYAQAEPRAALRGALGAGWICPVEAFKYQREFILGYSDTCVRDLESGPAVLLPHAYHDVAPLRRVLYGVVQQDRRCLAYAGSIKRGLNWLFRRDVLDHYLIVCRGPGRL